MRRVAIGAQAIALPTDVIAFPPTQDPISSKGRTHANMGGNDGAVYEDGSDLVVHDGFVPHVAPTVTSKWSKGSGGPAGDEVQNLVVVPMSPKALHDPSNALDASYGKGPGMRGGTERNVVVFRAPSIGEFKESSIADTLIKNSGAGNGETQNPAFVLHTDVIAFKPSHYTRGKDGAPSEITPPLSADADKGDQDTVVLARTLTAANNPSRSPQSTEVTQQVASVFLAFAQNQRGELRDHAVRRLTPVECEKLQGFPDGWSQVPYRGKPSADGPRYKALGNSMAVPVMRWIGSRIAKVDALTQA